MGHQRRALGDREDEDEVEEQLERADPLALAKNHPMRGRWVFDVLTPQV